MIEDNKVSGFRIVSFPPDPGVDYFMGCDTEGYDGKTYSLCVIGNDRSIKCSMTVHDKSEYNEQVKELAKYYNIPEDRIIYETK